MLHHFFFLVICKLLAGVCSKCVLFFSAFPPLPSPFVWLFLFGVWHSPRNAEEIGGAFFPGVPGAEAWPAAHPLVTGSYTELTPAAALHHPTLLQHPALAAQVSPSQTHMLSSRTALSFPWGSLMKLNMGDPLSAGEHDFDCNLKNLSK